MFLHSQSLHLEFRLHLGQLVAVTMPLAKAIKCLESPHTNPGDVLLFWLAVLAVLHDIFARNEQDLNLPADVIAKITQILNIRYASVFDFNPVYKTALFLTPCLHCCAFSCNG